MIVQAYIWRAAIERLALKSPSVGKLYACRTIRCRSPHIGIDCNPSKWDESFRIDWKQANDNVDDEPAFWCRWVCKHDCWLRPAPMLLRSWLRFPLDTPFLCRARSSHRNYTHTCCSHFCRFHLAYNWILKHRTNLEWHKNCVNERRTKKISSSPKWFLC